MLKYPAHFTSSVIPCLIHVRFQKPLLTFDQKRSMFLYMTITLPITIVTRQGNSCLTLNYLEIFLEIPLKLFANPEINTINQTTRPGWIDISSKRSHILACLDSIWFSTLAPHSKTFLFIELCLLFFRPFSL